MSLKKLKVENFAEIKFLDIEKASQYEEIDFSVFVNLEELWISSKTEFILPQNFTFLPKLKKLILDGNSRLPQNINELKTLKEVWLNDEGIYRVQESILKSDSIEILNIFYYPKLSEPKPAPEGIFQLKNLKKLRFSVCKFSEYNFENNQLDSLEELDFGCSLSDVKQFPDLSGLKNLKKLIVRGENVQGQKVPRYELLAQVLDSIKNLNQLGELDLSFWRPKNKSERLVIKDHKTSIPDVFEHFTNLKKLSLIQMKLDCIPASILELKNLKELEFGENNLDQNEITRIKERLPKCIVN